MAGDGATVERTNPEYPSTVRSNWLAIVITQYGYRIDSPDSTRRKGAEIPLVVVCAVSSENLLICPLYGVVPRHACIPPR
jgi:hypothetical protein